MLIYVKTHQEGLEWINKFMTKYKGEIKDFSLNFDNMYCMLKNGDMYEIKLI